MSKGVVVRPASAGDVDDVHRILVSAFGHPQGSERWKLRRRQAEEWQNFFVMERDGEPVGAVRIGKDLLRLGESGVLVKGDVGHVSIRLDLQGQGLGTRLMREAVRIMDERGFHISRLGGRMPFYSRFGYVPFPRRSCELSLSASSGRTASDDQSSASAEERIRPYDPGRDWEECCRLHDRFHAGCTATLVGRQPSVQPAGGADPTRPRWVFADGTGLRAYVFARQQEGTLEIDDAAGDPGRLEALAAVLRHVLSEAGSPEGRSPGGVDRAVAGLPFDENVARALIEAGVDVELRELQGACEGNMLLLLSLPRLAEAAAPEWSRRVREAGAATWIGVLELRVGDQAVKLALTPEEVTIAPCLRKPDVQLEVPARAFLLALLGYRSWDEVACQARGERPPSLTNALRQLFPRQPCAIGPLG
jgi:predicted N-acetyltransferase YhbS